MSAEVADLVSELVAFARGELGRADVSPTRSRLYDDGDYVRTEPAAALGNERRPGSVCDPTSRDTCVGSALEVLAYAVGEVPVRSTAQVPPSRSARDGVAVVTSGPPEVTSCQPRGTVTLFLDADEQIVGVDVAADTSERLCGEEGLVPPE